mmetsp:Transcript_31812/g.36082  ORF Transcript_31812/g.36082 Transcript_31812/m.36082 type:complete len:158 (+) Transcript_31812:114-587(+)
MMMLPSTTFDSFKAVTKSSLFLLLLVAPPTTESANCYSYHATSSCGDEACGMKCSGSYYAMDCGADIFDSGYDIEHTESCGSVFFGNAIGQQQMALEAGIIVAAETTATNKKCADLAAQYNKSSNGKKYKKYKKKCWPEPVMNTPEIQGTTKGDPTP